MHAMTCILHRKIDSAYLKHSNNEIISTYSNSTSNLESNDTYIARFETFQFLKPWPEVLPLLIEGQKYAILNPPVRRVDFDD